VKERLRKYKELPQYNYFRELNMDAISVASGYILSTDPGFYDFII